MGTKVARQLSTPFAIPRMTFNRKMAWIDDERIMGGGVIAYSKCSRLWLSGQDASSDWDIPPEEGSVAALDEENEISLASSRALVARLFIHEFLIEQHPDLFFEVDAGDRTALVNAVFERWVDYSPLRTSPLRTLYASDNISGRGALRIPLAEILRSRGYATRYMRVSLRMELGPGDARLARFRAWSDSKPALVPELPRCQSAKGDGGVLTLSAIVVDENGALLHQDDGIGVAASGQGGAFAMAEFEKSGVFKAQIPLDAAGNGAFSLKAEKDGKAFCASKAEIAITDGEFVRSCFDSQGAHSGYVRGGRHLGFMSGSTVLSDAVAALHVGTDEENIVLDAHSLMEKSGQPAGKTACLWMTSLNEAELLAWLEHRRECGYRLLLMANWSPDILNAGGAISPYGAEIAARIFGFCRKHDIYLKVDVTHDTFARHVIFPNLSQYREAGFLKDYEELLDIDKSETVAPSLSLCRETGFLEDYEALPDLDSLKGGNPWVSPCHSFYSYRDDSWCLPEARKLTESYFRHFCMLFRDETAIMLLSPCGEADYEIGARLVNPLMDCLRSFDGNHLLCVDLRAQLSRFRTPHADAGNVSCQFQEKHFTIAGGAGFGGYKNDMSSGAMLKFFKLNPNAGPVEGDCYAPSWPVHQLLAARPFHPAEECWRLKVRDFLWMALVHRYFAAYNWNELFMAGEHRMPNEAARLLDWQRFERRIPPAMLRVGELRNERDIERLIAYEELFSRKGLEYGLIWGKDPLPGGVEMFPSPNRKEPPYLVIDANAQRMASLDDLPPAVEKARITRLESSCYAASSCVSKGLDQLVVYLRNCSNYVTRDYRKQPESPHRSAPQKGAFKFALANLSPETKSLRVYDLDAHTLREEEIASSWSFAEKDASHDFAIVVSKKTQ